MIYLAAICMQQMPANISVELWTISVVEEAEEGSFGKGAAFLSASTWTAQSRSRVGKGARMFCMYFMSHT